MLILKHLQQVTTAMDGTGEGPASGDVNLAETAAAAATSEMDATAATPGESEVPAAAAVGSTASKAVQGTEELYNDGEVVWVRLGQSWWPGSVVALHRCPQDFLSDLKRTPLAVVKFFEENEYVDIHKCEHIYPYNCDRKNEFIKKGLNLRSMQNKEQLFKKFELDVLTAERLTGGESDVFTRIEEDSNKRRIDYSNLGFGPPKPKKKKEERTGASDISEAVHYKKGGGGAAWPPRQMRLEHTVVIMEQPHIENMKEDLQKSCNHYKCNMCSFTCSRLGVIVWHNKGHLKTVIDYDTGIRIPGRKRRKPKAKSKKKVEKVENGDIDHGKTNGHMATATGSVEAKRLLLDWDDEEEAAGAEAGHEPPLNNGGHSSDDASDSDEEAEDDYGRDRSERRPMRAAEELNSAFDALLADTPSSASQGPPPGAPRSYANNQSDSDTSDWEKYYDKSSDDEFEEAKESDIKSLCEASDDSDGLVSSTVTNGNLHTAATAQDGLPTTTSTAQDGLPTTTTTAQDSLHAAASPVPDKEDEADSTSLSESLPSKGPEPLNSNSASPEQSNQEDLDATEADDDDDDDDDDDEDEDGDTKETGRCSSLSSSPSTSGPAFMLVAVDAHGNNVPMPALTDRNHSSNLVAVEASMEDGTSRTLYIDPAYLEPNVDLSNLMLHIDNSGQETVIIPSTASADTAANATPPQDSMSSSSSSSASEAPQQEACVVSSEVQSGKEDAGPGAPDEAAAPSGAGAQVLCTNAAATTTTTTAAAAAAAAAAVSSELARPCDLDALSEASGVETTPLSGARNASYPSGLAPCRLPPGPASSGVAAVDTFDGAGVTSAPNAAAASASAVPFGTPSVAHDGTVSCRAPSVAHDGTVSCRAPSVAHDGTVSCRAPSVAHDGTVSCRAPSVAHDGTVSCRAHSSHRLTVVRCSGTVSGKPYTTASGGVAAASSPVAACLSATVLATDSATTPATRAAAMSTLASTTTPAAAAPTTKMAEHAALEEKFHELTQKFCEARSLSHSSAVEGRTAGLQTASSAAGEAQTAGLQTASSAAVEAQTAGLQTASSAALEAHWAEVSPGATSSSGVGAPTPLPDVRGRAPHTSGLPAVPPASLTPHPPARGGCVAPLASPASVPAGAVREDTASLQRKCGPASAAAPSTKEASTAFTSQTNSDVTLLSAEPLKFSAEPPAATEPSVVAPSALAAEVPPRYTGACVSSADGVVPAVVAGSSAEGKTSPSNLWSPTEVFPGELVCAAPHIISSSHKEEKKVSKHSESGLGSAQIGHSDLPSSVAGRVASCGDVVSPSASCGDVVSPSASCGDVVSQSASCRDVVSQSASCRDVVSPSASCGDVGSPSASCGDVVSQSASCEDVARPSPGPGAQDDPPPPGTSTEDDDLPDLGSLPAGTPCDPHPPHSLVWACVAASPPAAEAPRSSVPSPASEADSGVTWWPAWVCEAGPSSVTVRLILPPPHLPPSASLRLYQVEPFTCTRLGSFMARRSERLYEAYEAASRYNQLRVPLCTTCPAPRFFGLSDAEQQRLVAQHSPAPRGRRRGRPPKAVPAFTDEQLEAELRQDSRLQSSSLSPQLLQLQEEEEEGEVGADYTTPSDLELSARELRKLKSAVRARQRAVAPLVRYMRSVPCVAHLRRVLRGEVPNERHTLYQSPDARPALKAQLKLGPLSSHDLQSTVNDLVAFLTDELATTGAAVSNSAEYVILVWLPEAIREAVRVVRRLGQQQLEAAMDDPGPSTPTERKARRLFC